MITFKILWKIKMYLLMAVAFGPSIAQAQFSDPNLIRGVEVFGGSDIAPGDFDLDGVVDAVVVSEGLDRVSIFWGEIDEDFTTSQLVTDSIEEPYRMTYGDIDHDGDLDLIVSSNANFKIYAIENLGGGSFADPQEIAQLDQEVVTMELNHLNDDDDLDLLVGIQYPSDISVAVMYGLGNGDFAPYQAEDWNAPTLTTVCATAGDIDGDGDNDLVHIIGNRIFTKLNDGFGVFGNEVVYDWNPGYDHAVLVDFENDDDLDILMLMATAAYYERVVCFENDGIGGFENSYLVTDSIPTGVTGANWIEAADIDNDDLPEIFVSSIYGGHFFFVDHLGNGLFGPNVRLTSMVGGPPVIRGYDQDNSGFADVFFAANTRPGVFRNNGGSLAPIPDLLSSNVVSPELKILDIDQNGHQDIIASTGGSSGLCWFEFDGTDNCSALRWAPEVFSLFNFRQFADFDGDGLLDLLYLSSADDQIVWVRNLGQGVFGDAVQLLAYDDLSSLEVSDCDDDDDMDIIYCEESSGNTGILFNDGAGIFTHVLIDGIDVPGARLHHLRDMDGDGDQDIILADGEELLNWYDAAAPGDFTGTSSHVVLTEIAGHIVEDIAIGDIDGDLDTDVLCRIWNYQTELESLWLFKNDGEGGFGPPTFLFSHNTSSNDGGTGLEFTDLDGDLDLDIVTAYGEYDQVVWLENDGAGSFSDTLVLFDQIGDPYSFTVGDLDGDLDLDMVVNGQAGSKLYWAESLVNISTTVPEKTSSGLEVFPNPTKGELTVGLNGPQNQNGTLELFNLVGELVFSTNLTNNKFTFNIGAHPAGIYLLRFTNGVEAHAQTIVLTQ